SPENSSEENVVSKTNQEPPQDSDIHQLIEECSIKVPEQQKQKMEDTMLELVKICQAKEFLCIRDDVDNLIESALDSKLLLINSNSQRLDKQDITPEMESDEVTESNAENLLPIPSKCEDNPSIPRPPPEPPDVESFFDLKPDDYPPEIEVILCRIYVRFPRSSYPLIDFGLGRLSVHNREEQEMIEWIEV
nr:hypothetical protein [Tanacetum cinerariifolium]